jgi:hypothetical protein
MTTNAMTFGPDLLVIAKLSAGICHPKIGMAWHTWATRTWYPSAASLIRPIWRIFKGLEVADMV